MHHAPRQPLQHHQPNGKHQSSCPFYIIELYKKFTDIIRQTTRYLDSLCQVIQRKKEQLILLLVRQRMRIAQKPEQEDSHAKQTCQSPPAAYCIFPQHIPFSHTCLIILQKYNKLMKLANKIIRKPPQLIRTIGAVIFSTRTYNYNFLKFQNQAVPQSPAPGSGAQRRRVVPSAFKI